MVAEDEVGVFECCLAVHERDGVEYGACYFSSKSWIHQEAADNVLVPHYRTCA